MNSLTKLAGTVIFCATLMIGQYTYAESLYQQAKAAEDVDRAIELYWQYFQAEDEDAEFADAASDFARLLAKHERVEELAKLGTRLLSAETVSPSAMNTIAWALAEAGKDLELAESVIKTGVEAQRQEIEAPPPEDRSAKAWKERQTFRLVYYLDTYGYVLLRKSDAREALEALLEAESLSQEPDGELYKHMAQAYQAQDKTSRALNAALKSRYYSGEEDPDVQSIIEEMYRKSTGTQDGLEEFIANRLDDLRDEEYSVLVHERINEPAKAFTLKSLDGAEVSLSDFRGKIVLVDFWATWCGPCRMEMPLLQEAYSGWEKEGVVLLAISTDKDTAKVAPFIEENQYSFTVLFNDNTSRDYDVAGIPSLFVIDQAGMLQYKHIGYRPDIVDILKRQFAALRQ